jgi:hypothetical protein
MKVKFYYRFYLETEFIAVAAVTRPSLDFSNSNIVASGSLI